MHMQNAKNESTHAWFRLSTNAACCYGLAATYRDPHSVVYAVKGRNPHKRTSWKLVRD